METTHFYDVDVKWNKDRKGTMTSPALHTGIDVATPPEFKNGIPGIWSPEHLLVAAVDSCLMTTFLAIAENSTLNFLHFESRASGKLEIINGKHLITEIVLSPVLTIPDISEKERAERILQKAEQACLISNSIRSTIIFRPEIRVARQL